MESGRFYLQDQSRFRSDPSARGDGEEGKKTLEPHNGTKGQDGFTFNTLILSLTESETELKCAPDCQRVAIEKPVLLAHLLAYWARSLFGGQACCFFEKVVYSDDRKESQKQWDNWHKLVCLKRISYATEKEWRFIIQHSGHLDAIEARLDQDNFWHCAVFGDATFSSPSVPRWQSTITEFLFRSK